MLGVEAQHSLRIEYRVQRIELGLVDSCTSNGRRRTEMDDRASGILSLLVRDDLYFIFSPDTND